MLYLCSTASKNSRNICVKLRRHNRWRQRVRYCIAVEFFNLRQFYWNKLCRLYLFSHISSHLQMNLIWCKRGRRVILVLGFKIDRLGSRAHQFKRCLSEDFTDHFRYNRLSESWFSHITQILVLLNWLVMLVVQNLVNISALLNQLFIILPFLVQRKATLLILLY